MTALSYNFLSGIECASKLLRDVTPYGQHIRWERVMKAQQARNFNGRPKNNQREKQGAEQQEKIVLGL